MVKMLDTRCEVCGSWSWCGRKCAKADPGEGWVPVLMTHGEVKYCPACHEEHVETYTCNALYEAKLARSERSVSKVEARREYQRELMRKRRLEAKLKAHTT
jgi:hypothetical protein